MAKIMVGGVWKSPAEAQIAARLPYWNHPGHGNQKSHGRRGISTAELEDTYGEIEESWDLPQGGLIAVHENGDITVSFDDADGLDVWGEFGTPGDAREVADAVTGAVDDAAGGGTNGPNGLVDHVTTGNKMIVGHNAAGEIVAGAPKSPGADPSQSLDDYDTVFMDSDQAQDFADFLTQAADVSEAMGG